MQLSPLSFYQSQLEKYTREATRLRSELNTLSVVRLVLFAAILVLFYFIIAEGATFLWVVLLVTVVAFAFSIKRFERKKEERDYAEAFVTINRNEIAALEGNDEAFDAGEDFINPAHSYTYDLDIFGKGSIYQHINRSATLSGRALLAQWMQQPLLSPESIITRQEAVQELAQKPEWRQRFLATSQLHKEEPHERNELQLWLNEPVFLVENPLWPVLEWVVLVCSIVLIAVVISGYLPFQALLLYLLFPLGIVGTQLKKINALHQSASRFKSLFAKQAALLVLLEGESWSAAEMAAQRSKLDGEGTGAAAGTARLSRYISLLDNRMNMLAALFLNGLLLWDIRYARRIEQWKQLHREQLPKWFAALNHVDALCSVANFRYNYPDYTFPDPNGPEVIFAEELGHPLLLAKERVNNDFAIKPEGELVLVTGANMAGKSTFLRAVGVSFILAMNGAPVCAQVFRFRPRMLYTSMRTTDSLQRHESYFFAELKRLQGMVERLEKGEELFVMVDEMLKGTNSTDQHKGAEALTKKLIRLHTSGLIATHDLELGILATQYPGAIRNECFEIAIDEKGMRFDYKLHPGLSQNMNASFLLAQMGIV